MLSYTLGVQLADDTVHEVVADARDFRAWERRNDKPAIGTGLSVTMLTELAFSAGVRAGFWPDDLDAFDASCVGIEVMNREQPRPTKPGRGAAS